MPNFKQMTLVQWIIFLVVLAGIIGVAFVVIHQMGIVVPAFMITIGWILVAVVVGVVAIRFLASMMQNP